MRYRHIACLVACAFVVVCLALAGTASQAEAQTDQTLYTELGGKEGLERITADMIAILVKDPRTAPQFDNINLDWLTQRITLYFCMAVGGPCHYPGRDMYASHKGLHLATREFNALVEDLQIAMEHARVATPVQNRFLALLAPLFRDIVTR
jgi:hemoglobin